MKKNNLLKQMEMFDEMSRNKLSPNQYYLLCCIKDSVTPIKINIHLELRSLVNNQWLSLTGKKYKLTPKSMTLIDKLEKLFRLKKTTTSSMLMGKDFKKNIETYKEMFPNIKLPSGKAARSAIGNLEKNFRWFFENHKYNWEIVLKATAHYINDHQKKGYKFMRTSQYFIRKDSLSDLADYCEIIMTDGDKEEKNHHSIKVV